MVRSFVSIKKLSSPPYSGILGYPSATTQQINSRIGELEKLGISSISLTGPAMLGKLAVLGKGYVGVVVLARRKGRRVALKIRRTDSQRDSMRGEAGLLKQTNSVGVGPKMIAVSKNFLVMKYVKGVGIGKWIDSLGGRGSAKKLKFVIRSVLEDCFKLDQMGFDHGELSNISKHVMVDDVDYNEQRRGSQIINYQVGPNLVPRHYFNEKGHVMQALVVAAAAAQLQRPIIIDFDSSSTKRRPSNVTSAAQAILIGTGIAKKSQKIYKNSPKEEIIDALKQYKQERTQKSFDLLLHVLRV